MPLSLRTTTLLTAGLVLTGLTAAASDPTVTSPSQTQPQISAAHTITVNPTVTRRGSSVEVTVANAPLGAKRVTVGLDGQTLPTTELHPGTYTLAIPDLPVAGEGGPTGGVISLGKHSISVSFDGRWFTGDATLTVVNTEQNSPLLTDVEAQQVTNDPDKNVLTITGSGFIQSPAQDNQILIDGVVMPVTWDGCPDAKDSTSGSPHAVSRGAHGSVDSSSQIRLCYLRMPAKLQVDVGVRQGVVNSNVKQVYVLPFSTTRVVLLSLCTVLGAVGLVIFLASCVREYRVNKTTYGMFRILYLDPETNTYSLSKYQFYMWTAVALFSYTYLALSKVFIQGGSLPDVPTSLPGIIGIGAATAIGAQVVTTVRGPKGGGSELPGLGDFVTSGGVAAPERVQMFVWTNLGALAFCIAVLHDPPWHIVDMPKIGDGLMYLMGISSAGYLGGKLARKPGPVLNEISISPAGPDGWENGAGALAQVHAPQGNQRVGDLSQPIAAAQQASRDAQTAVAAVPAASSPAAFSAAQSALQALRAGIAAAIAAGPEVLGALEDNASAADAGSQLAAAEFARIIRASPDDPQLANARILAEQAQRCAAAAQDLATGVAQSVGTVQAAAAVPTAMGSGSPAIRSIDLRGRNLSLDATFEINDREVPFRMLADDGGTKAPRMVAPEDDANQVKMARELRLSIDPRSLGQADRASYIAWFGSGVESLKLAITNPDGQRSEISVSVPPGSRKAQG